MERNVGILIICSDNTIPNETGANHFDIAPGISIDFVRDISEFLAPFAREEWKARLGTKGWEQHIDPIWCSQKWVVTIEQSGEVHALSAEDYWTALKLTVPFNCHLNAYFLYGAIEDGVFRPRDSWKEENWFDTVYDVNNIPPLTRAIFDRWVDFATKLHPLHRGKEACARSDRFTTGLDLFCRGLQEHDIRHRLNCFIPALEALICSPEGRQKEYFFSRIKCFWPHDQPKILPPKQLTEIIDRIFLLKNKLDHLKEIGNGDTIWTAYWWIVFQAEQLARSAYSVVLSSPEHYACFTDFQRQQAFWASRDTGRILFQTSASQAT